MAERTTQSWTSAPHFYLLREVDAGRLGSWREAAKRTLGRDVSVTDLLVRATAAALSSHPRANAAWAESGIRLNDEVNVGIAVAVEEGLVVPVVHGADRIGLGAIAARREDVVARARDGLSGPMTSRAAPSRSPTWACSASMPSTRSSTPPGCDPRGRPDRRARRRRGRVAGREAGPGAQPLLRPPGNRRRPRRAVPGHPRHPDRGAGRPCGLSLWPSGCGASPPSART